jgi:hypothetical protein
MKAPDDFPLDKTPAAVSGAQPKIAGRLVDGQFVVGQTAEERDERWDVCEDLARQLMPKALRDAEKHPEHTKDETLLRMRGAVAAKGWVSPEELGWLIERLRVLLGW